MQCINPNCLHPDSHVVDSYKRDEFSVIRRRECLSCKMRFTTIEKMQERKIPKKALA